MQVFLLLIVGDCWEGTAPGKAPPAGLPPANRSAAQGYTAALAGVTGNPHRDQGILFAKAGGEGPENIHNAR